MIFTLIGWGVASLEEWPEYLKLAIPGTIMISAEWTGYEIIQIVLGVVSTVELAVSGILSSYVVFVFMVCRWQFEAGILRTLGLQSRQNLTGN